MRQRYLHVSKDFASGHEMLKHRSLRSRGAVGVRVDARVQPFASFSRWYTQIRSQYPTVKKRLSGDFLYMLALGKSAFADAANITYNDLKEHLDLTPSQNASC